jgi:broad specificity phosphatase PhoE
VLLCKPHLVAQVELRPVGDGDWEAIDALADVAVGHLEGAPRQREWSTNRRRFRGSRRHQVAVRAGRVVGYGGIERSAEDPPHAFRVFLVLDWSNPGVVAETLMEQLERDLADLHVTTAWLREYARDQPLLDYFAGRGFSISSPYEVGGEQIVTLQRRSDERLQIERTDPPSASIPGRVGRVGCLVLVVQHGEKARLPGDPGLTEAGHVEAATTAAWLHSAQAVTRVVSSPARRAVETAEPIAERYGLEVSVDDRLRERMNWEGAADGTLDEFLAEWSRASEDRSFVPRGGDSSQQAADRFIAALNELADEANPGEQLVVVAHGGVTVDALRTLLGDAYVRARQPALIDAGVPCCAITRLKRAREMWTAELPSTEHLERPVDHRRA